MKKIISKGFTLIELLIVIGILGILVVAVLLTLNPAEAQKKARDSKRMKDLATIQSVMDQYVQGGGSLVACTATWTTTGVNPSGAVDGSGWIPLVVSTYISSEPLDPQNNTTKVCAGSNAGGAAQGCNCPAVGNCAAPTAQNMVYRARCSTGGTYEVDVRQESLADVNNVLQDGGDAGSWAEVGTDLALITGN